MDPTLDGPTPTPPLNGLSLTEPGRQDRLPRPGQRGRCQCSGDAVPVVSRPVDTATLQAPPPPRVNVQEELPVQISLDGDGALLATFPRAAAAPSHRLAWLLDSGKRMLNSASAYTAVGSADDAEPVGRLRTGVNGMDWPDPEEEVSGSHYNFSASNGASVRFDMEDDIDGVGQSLPRKSDWPGAELTRHVQLNRNKSMRIAGILLACTLVAIAMAMRSPAGPIDSFTTVAEQSHQGAENPSAVAARPSPPLPPPPPSWAPPSARLHYIAYKVNAHTLAHPSRLPSPARATHQSLLTCAIAAGVWLPDAPVEPTRSIWC